MEENQIREAVNSRIENWLNFQEKRANRRIEITEKAKDFIIEVIQNIKDDPSKYWLIDNNYESLQVVAIQLIPKALSRSVRNNRLDWYSDNQVITISSWELWRSLSTLIKNFCFIPEDDM